MERVCSELGAYLRGWKEFFKLADHPVCFVIWTDGSTTG
jgi:hypothetical protein